MTIVLGNTYQDKITRFKGVATGHVTYLSGCNQVLLVPQVNDKGELVASEWFDEQRCEYQEAPAVVLNNALTPGFDKMAPKR